MLSARIQGKAYSSPLAPPLLAFRFSEVCAFSMIGVDFEGPVFVKDIFADGPTMYKSYILIVTCASTRAIHLELTPDLTAPFVVL